MKKKLLILSMALLTASSMFGWQVTIKNTAPRSKHMKCGVLIKGQYQHGQGGKRQAKVSFKSSKNKFTVQCGGSGQNAKEVKKRNVSSGSNLTYDGTSLK